MRLHNELMSKHTTFKIGGPAEVLSIPKDEESLLAEIKYCQENEIPFHILGRGSNILVRDIGIKGFVIKNTCACTQLSINENIVEAGSSVSLQKFVRFCVDNDLEGMEYLYSIPGTIGGAIYTNAGRGKKYNLSISDKLVSVKIFDGERVMVLNKENCEFGHRSSIFQKKKNWMVLSSKFELLEQAKDVGNRKIKERLDFAKRYQDLEYPSAGSIFKNWSGPVLSLMKNVQIGKTRFSHKTINWINNLGGAKAEDVIKLINRAKLMHMLVLKKPVLEIEIW